MDYVRDITKECLPSVSSTSVFQLKIKINECNSSIRCEERDEINIQKIKFLLFSK